jgi:alpha-tubulin suppressor-like RCC1 family protein
VRVCQVCAGAGTAFAICEGGELFSWGSGVLGRLGHGDARDQPLPKHVEALRDIRMSGAAARTRHAIALSEDGQVCIWGEDFHGALLGDPRLRSVLLPKPVEVPGACG